MENWGENDDQGRVYVFHFFPQLSKNHSPPGRGDYYEKYTPLPNVQFAHVLQVEMLDTTESVCLLQGVPENMRHTDFSI